MVTGLTSPAEVEEANMAKKKKERKIVMRWQSIKHEHRITELAQISEGKLTWVRKLVSVQDVLSALGKWSHSSCIFPHSPTNA